MGVVIEGYERHLASAVRHYWKTLGAQSQKQASGAVEDRGRRSAVTGGKQMGGFCDLFEWVLEANGLRSASIFRESDLELPGYFRPNKQWDMIVVDDGKLVAAIEFKSQRGPSFGNNFNNRTEEALGTAADLWTAFREGALGGHGERPWLGWVMLLEEAPGSTRPVAVKEPHFEVFPEFHGASYAKRYELKLRKLVAERHYTAASLLLTTEAAVEDGRSREPAPDLGMKQMLASLAGHAAAHFAAR